MQMIPIFGTWVGVARLESLDIKGSLEHVNGLDMERDSTDGATTITQRLLDAPIFREVKEECERLTLQYVGIQGHQVGSISIASSWGNTLGRNHAIRVHQHPNSYVSGVFYLTEGAPINFHNPLQTEDLFMVRPLIAWDENNPHTWQVLRIPIKPGYLLLFPSRINHHVDGNDNDFRYSIAFNTMPTGSIGDSTKELNIVRVE